MSQPTRAMMGGTKMKLLISVAVVALLSLGLVACGGDEAEERAPAATATPEKPTATIAATDEGASPALVPLATATFVATATGQPAADEQVTAPTVTPEPTSGEEVVTATASPEAATQRPSPEEGIQVASEEVVNNFPDEVVFRLSAESAAIIEHVTLRYRLLPDGILASYVPSDFSPAERVEVAFHLKANDPPRMYIAPGTEIEYSWEIEDAVGNKLNTDPSNFFCLDIRFPWESVSEGNLTLYWYAGDRSSAEASLTVDRDTLDEMSKLLGVTVDYPVKVWIYDSYQDMLPALVRRSGGQAVAVAGERVASDTVLVLGGYGYDDILRHELTHIVTHVAGEGPYGGLPTWLDEGTAMYGQSEPGEGYTSALDRAVERDSLFSVRSMSAPPADPSKVALFYGQAWSLVSYLIETYGPGKFAELFAAFKGGGATVDEVLLKVYGFDQDELENEWRASLGLAAPR